MLLKKHRSVLLEPDELVVWAFLRGLLSPNRKDAWDELSLVLRSYCSIGGKARRIRSADFHLFKHMFYVQPSGNKLRAFLGHSPQQPFPAFVDGRDVIEVDNAGPLVLSPVRPLPGCSEFADPRPHQASLHDPFPFCRRLRHGDLQHAYLSCLLRARAWVSARTVPR